MPLSLQEKLEMVIRARLRVEPELDRDAVVEWLAQTNPLLHGRTPTEVVQDGGLDYILNKIGTPESRNAGGYTLSA